MIHPAPRKSYSIKEAKRIHDSLVLVSDRGQLCLSPVNENIVRIRYTEKEDFTGKLGIGILYKEKYGGWSFSQDDTCVTLTMPKLCLKVTVATGSISYYNGAGELLLAERDYQSRELEEFDSFDTVVDENIKIKEVQTADGMKRTITDMTKKFNKKLYHTKLNLVFSKDERIFGLGQAEEGTLNFRGTTQYLHQANLKIAIPFMLSNRGYGLLSATGSPAIFNDNEYGTYLYTEADEEMDYYFIAGKKMDEIIGGYRLLSGKAAMLPKWAFGFMQSQERYETQEEIIQVAEEFHKRQIGVDCIILDWQSWPENQWGQKSFDEKRFPNPGEMIDKLHEMNIRFMISIWPNMRKATPNYNEFFEQNLLLPASEIYDAFNEDARKLYWKQVSECLYVHGVDSWWCDSSEPITPEWGRRKKPLPEHMYTEFYKTASQYLLDENTNSYGLLHARTIWDGQRGESNENEKRIVNLTRSGYTGAQRYGVILWSGDTYAAWETLKKQIVAGLNFCASGLPYWTLDIGAFFVKKGEQWFWNGDYEKGTDDLGFRELYVRWYQYGAFLPIFRCHGTDVRREIWNYGDKGDIFYDAMVDANKLRYQLIPYIYSLAGGVWLEDSTMMRMLAFDFSNDEKALDTADQYMFGGNIMVCPVTEPMYYAADSVELTCEKKGRNVYLPSGCDWYDFHTGEKYSGGQTIFAKAEIDTIPLFVKAGSLIPMTEPLMNTSEDADITIHVYPGADAAFTLYEDSGDGYGYEKGEYTLTKLSWIDSEAKLITDNGRVFQVVVHR